ncbi:hypothetical protein [Robertmurraya korlensis]|uniref:hypothetical protein n=1 Tax=Robertmurraya korlensis TaxID=519977 RepID=UPI0008259E89|nr:hypothetical protein [Robertmurraya korlensis]
MCVSNHAFEFQAYKMSEQIINHTIYQPVRVVYFGEKDAYVNDINPLELITKIILQDNEGHYYEVEPSENGIRFAKGEITYQEYLQLGKKDIRNLITYSSASIGTIFILSWALVNYFL